MDEQQKQQLDEAKAKVASFVAPVTKKFDQLGEKALNFIKEKVPAVAKEEDAKVAKTILMINLAATALVLFAYYCLPAMPNIKGDGTMTFSKALTTIGEFMEMAKGFGGGDEMAGAGFAIFMGRSISVLSFINLGLGLYTFATEKVLPFITVRLVSILAFLVTLYTLFGALAESGLLIGVYVMLIGSIIMGLSGFLITSKK